MQVNEAILGRRTVYRYQDKAIPGEVVERALEAARWAPNHKLTDPWRFVVVGRQTLEALGVVAERVARQKAADLPLEEQQAIVERQVKKVTTLPLLVVVLQVRNREDAFRHKEDYAACCCAIQNISLSLWADGVGSQWGTGTLTRDDEARRILHVDDGEDVVGFIKAGYPSKIPTTRRAPLAEVTRHLP